MKRILFLSVLICLSCLSALPRRMPVVVAHRGCHLGATVPENSVEGVRMAARYGYPAIECDVHYTKDSVMVVMHDTWDMRRVLRLRDGYRPVTEKLPLSSLTFSELRRDYVLASDAPALRTPVPTLEEILKACKACGIVPMLHSDIVDSYRLAQQMLGDRWIAFAGSPGSMCEARKLSKCLLLFNFNDAKAEDIVADLKQYSGRRGMSSMNFKMFSPHFCQVIRQAGFEVQSSIFPKPHDGEAIRNGASLILSDFCYLPNKQKRPYRRLRIAKRTMSAGDSLILSGPREEYGACTLNLRFKGRLEITLCGGQSYIVDHAENAGELLGQRLFREEGTVKVRALTDTQIASSHMDLYRF